MKGPWWWKRRTSCPECGYIYDGTSTTDKILMGSPYITCPKCQVRLSSKEFWDANHSKYDRTSDISETG